jgi:molecular chaperone DnaJ
MQEFGQNIMSDPYKVLGVSRDATEDEIKKAYREMSRKYHPDANINNPNKDKAEEMFKLVQQAYDQIMNERKYGSSYGNSEYGSYSGSGYGGYNRSGSSGNGSYTYGDPFGGFGGFGGFNYGSTGQKSSSEYQDPHYTAASNYINNRHYQEALNVLNSIENRNAYWYFLSAVANNGVGNNVLALDLAKTAVQMEPSNTTYQRLVHTLEQGGSWYSERQTEFGMGDDSICFVGNPCATLLCLSLCCNPYRC